MSSLAPVRFSYLKNIAKSPAHYRHSLTRSWDSPALKMGRLVDCALLGGCGELIVWEATRRGKAWEEFKAAHDGEEIYTASEVASAQPIIDAVRANSDAMGLLASGVQKRRISWEWLGRECSGEPDVAGTYLVDLKTTRSADPNRFTRDALWFGYHAQLAWYRNGLQVGRLGNPRKCLIVAVEKTAPYPVTIFEMTESALSSGLRMCRSWMERLLNCEASDHWPAYCQTAVPIDVVEDVELTFGDEEDSE